MKIIFMGTPDFSVGALKALYEAGHDIVLAVTQPDKAKGRGKNVQPSPVKEAAVDLGIKVYQPKRVRDPECIEYLRVFGADIIVVAAFGQILPREILDMPRFGCVNVHASLLPKYRGASPIQWAVINGEKTSGVTIMRMDEGLDTGDIIMQKEVALDEKETAGSLFEKLGEAGSKLLVKALDAIENGTAVYTKQDDTLATNTGQIKKELGDINWSLSAAAIERLIRGLTPWPSAYTHLNGKTLKIWDADTEPSPDAQALPGTILRADKDAFLVQTGDGALSVKLLQLEGKKKMGYDAFLRGYKAEKGTMLNEQRRRL